MTEGNGWRNTSVLSRAEEDFCLFPLFALVLALVSLGSLVQTSRLLASECVLD